jgi:uncharacterized protein
MNLLPRDEKFFDLLQQHVRILRQASELFLTGVQTGPAGVARISKQMEALERNADEVLHNIFNRLQTTFITPFDPEDIQTLATGLDNVLDAIEDTTFRITCYRVSPLPESVLPLAQIIGSCCQALERALAALEDKKPVLDDCIEVNRLENEADAIERTAIGDLFGSEIDPITLIKHKEVIELLERTTDLCEDVADVIQNVAVKNS